MAPLPAGYVVLRISVRVILDKLEKLQTIRSKVVDLVRPEASKSGREGKMRYIVPHTSVIWPIFLSHPLTLPVRERGL